MRRSIDLNADMGESFGSWQKGSDELLLDVVTSANIACGFHAGDADVMAKTMAAAVKRGVGIGAHPGFPDLQGFGRRRMHIPGDTLANWVRYQMGAAQAMAMAAGGKVTHVKLHGALSNMCSENTELARTCFKAALSVDPDVTVMVLASTAMEEAAQELECSYAAEIFADRAYNDDATLVDRTLPGAVIHDAAYAASRIESMVNAKAIIAESGKRIPSRIDTVCVHGDNDEAVALASGVRQGLESAGIEVRGLG